MNNPIKLIEIVKKFFILELCRIRRKHIHRLVFFLTPVLFQLIIFSNPVHHMFFKSINFIHLADMTVLRGEWGILFYFFTIYNYFLIILASVFLIKYSMRASVVQKKQAMLLISAQFLTIFVNFFYVFNGKYWIIFINIIYGKVKNF